MDFLIIIVLWFLFSVLVGTIAINRAKSAFGYFFLSLLISPLVGIIILLSLPANKEKLELRSIEDGEQKICPYCAETIKTAAIVCRFCGRDFPEHE